MTPSLIASSMLASVVVVPTIDLLHQWHDVLTSFLGTKIGTLGGGSRETNHVQKRSATASVTSATPAISPW